MSETFLLGVGLISGLAVWKYAVKPTFLDEARDSLFDLRDSELRAFFLKKENGLQDPLYIKMRDLLNGLLRYTENASLISFLITIKALSKNQHLLKRIDAAHVHEYTSADVETTEVCSKIREKANSIMMRYMIRTSFLGQIVRYVAYAVITLRALYSSLKSFHKPIWTAACTAATGAAIVTNFATHVAPGVSSATVKNAVEARAMRQI